MEAAVWQGGAQTLPLAVRVFSWIASVSLVIVLGTVTAATLRAQNTGAHEFVAAKPALVGAYQGAEIGNLRSYRQIPLPSPSPVPTSAPATSQHSTAAPPRPASIVIGSTQQVLINRDRASAGLGPLTWNSCLYNVAVSNAKRMAAQGYISHTNGPSLDLGCRLGNQAGENVGWWSGGVNDTQINSMFWNSPEHRANILGPYHYVATAWVVASNGYGYIAVEFG
jgi:uncharacterized protein YkwD